MNCLCVSKKKIIYWNVSWFQVYFSDTKLGVTKMPKAIEYSVRKQNIKFMHNRNQFNPEYFQFIRKLVSCDPYSTVNRHGHEKHVSWENSCIISKKTSFLCFFCRVSNRKSFPCWLCNWRQNFCSIQAFVQRRICVGQWVTGTTFWSIIC